MAATEIFDRETESRSWDDPVSRFKVALAKEGVVKRDIVPELKEAIRAGNWDACPWLAVCYSLGWGVEKDRFVYDILMLLAEAKGTREINAVQEYVEILADSVKETVESSDGRFEAGMYHAGKLIFEFLSDYTVIDIETTGFSPNQNDITEIAAIRVRNGEAVERFQELVRPSQTIPGYVVGKTHISNEMVAGARSIKEVLPAFLEFVGSDVLVGYNIYNFDIPFLCCKSETELGRSITNDIVDVIYLVKDLCPRLCSYKLDDIRRRLGIDCAGAHRALKDCEDTQALYLRLKNGQIDFGVVAHEVEAFAGFEIPDDYSPVQKSGIPTHYKERWEHVKAHPFTTLASSNIVFTGDGPNMPRDVAEKTAVILGADVRPRVTRDCDFCVVLESPGLTKVEAAKKWSASGSPIRILSLEAFKEIVAASLIERA